MEVVIAVAAVAALLAWADARPPRFRPWRGPTEGTLDRVQREHLDLFLPPPADEEDDG